MHRGCTMMVSLRRRMATAAVVLATMAGVVAGGAPASAAGEAPPASELASEWRSGAKAASAADRCYTASLHQVFLGRPASTYDLEVWIDRYDPAPARPALPRALAVSDEWLEAVVVGIYDDALDRAPDPDGLEFWIGRLRAGARVATLTAQVYGSTEVWNRAGATAEGFVADVFPRIMGRAPSPDDVDYWAGEVPGRGRGGVAKALVGSIENRRDRVTALYEAVLGRAPDPAGRDYWASRLATLDDVQLAVHLASSAEAYQRAQVGCTVPPGAVTTDLTDGRESAQSAQISADGRWVAFIGGHRDLYLLDRTTDEVTRVTENDEDVHAPAISADGRHLAFITDATDVLPGEVDDDGHPDLYSWDRTTGETTRITDGNREASFPSLSPEGRYVAFASYASDLVADDLNAREDVFVWDRTTGTTERITDGAESSSGAVISADGGRVAFSSWADDLAPGGTPDSQDTFVWERATGTTTWVATGYPEAMADDGDLVIAGDGYGLVLVDSTAGERTTVVDAGELSGFADISADGTSVTFTSWSDDLFPGDLRNTPDVFVWERATGTILRVSPRGHVASSSTTSADGRYVAFQSAPRVPGRLPGRIILWDRGS